MQLIWAYPHLSAPSGEFSEAIPHRQQNFSAAFRTTEVNGLNLAIHCSNHQAATKWHRCCVLSGSKHGKGAIFCAADQKNVYGREWAKLPSTAGVHCCPACERPCSLAEEILGQCAGFERCSSCFFTVRTRMPINLHPVRTQSAPSEDLFLVRTSLSAPPRELFMRIRWCALRYLLSHSHVRLCFACFGFCQVNVEMPFWIGCGSLQQRICQHGL